MTNRQNYMENDNELLDSNNEEEEVEIVLDDETEEEADDVEVLKKELATLKAQRKHWKTKATKPVEAPKEEVKQDSLSSRDLYALMTAGVNQEDISEVEDYAKLKQIPIADALKSSFVKSFLKDKEEERKTASATHSGASKRTTKELSDDVLLSKASKGELPESDDELARLIRARIDSKRRK